VKNGHDSDVTPPEELDRLTQDLSGEGTDVESAVKNAWGKRKSSDPKVYRVKEVFVWGENPISGYRVVIGP
jgi:hypothetical protein